MLSHKRYANPSGSKESKEFLHAQRIEGETLREYNPSKSLHYPNGIKRYAELIGNYKNCEIKSLQGNKTGQGQEDTTSTTLTMGVLQTQFSNASIGSDHPTVGMATRANYDRYYNLLQPQQRFMDVETAKGGFSSLMFNGIPIIADSYCPTNHIFLINENYLDLYIHRDENFRFEPFIKPIDQNVKVAKIYFAGALGSSNNRMHAKIEAITA